MVKVRVLSKTPVIVGHRQLLPGETHEVAGGDLNAAVVLYGADAFRLLFSAGAQPATDNSDVGEAASEDGGAQTVVDSGDPVTDDEEPTAAPRRRRQKGL